MKRAFLAGLLLLPLALARTRAQETAYVSLVGMADSASTDRGPQAGEIPQGDLAPMEGRPASEPNDGSAGSFSSTAPESPIIARPEDAPPKPAAKPVKREARKEGDAPTVAVPAPSAPRIWTQFFSSLLPASSPASSFEVAVSTVPRVRAKTARLATSASSAGAAQGFLELVATATAP
jgi:hypothetical protein